MSYCNKKPKYLFRKFTLLTFLIIVYVWPEAQGALASLQ